MSTRIIAVLFVLKAFIGCFGVSQDDVIDLSHYGIDIYGKPVEHNSRGYSAKHGNAEERGPYLEGDLLIPLNSRNRIQSHSLRWLKGEIPYEVIGSFKKPDQDVIKRAFHEFHTKTCLKFILRRHSDKDYISIASESTGCWSSVGRIGGKQVVNLEAPGCTTLVGTVIHELLHAAGFMHEQNREDRDRFVFIRYNNIEADKRRNFEKSQTGETTGFDVPYDYGSVMHYSSVAFSINGKPTIDAIRKTNEVMGQRNGFSKKDVEKIKKMYSC